MREVLSCNWSKYPKTDWYVGKYHCDSPKDFADMVCEGIEKRGRYKGVTYHEIDGRLVFKSDEGKILKPPSFREPNHYDSV